jgi:DNA invertase Pin-like site-specific DNA recombinase
MKNALAYARVSTKEQAEKGLSIPAQLKAIREYAKSHGFRILEEYVDEGESAKTSDRPAFKRMMKRCQKDKSIDAIIVHKIDRFARNNIDFYACKAILKKEGIALISVTENIEETPAGQFLEGVCVAMAQFYSSNLAEEVLKGMKEKFERGEWPVTAPVGYKNVRDEKGHAYVIQDEKTAPLIRQMFELYATGQYSLISLSEEMAKRGLRSKKGKLLTAERIRQILRNKFYIGKMVMWGKEVLGKHKPIVDKDLFNRVQRILEERRLNQEKWQRRDFLLRGLLYCENCQKRLTAESHPRGDYYRCQNNINNKCSEPYIPTKLIESQIKRLYELMQPSPKLLKLLKAEIEEVIRNFQEKSKDEISRLKRKIAENEAKLDALIDSLASRTITPEIYKKYSQKYEEEIKEAKERLAVLEKDYSSNFDFIDKCMILASTISKLHKKFSFRQRKNLARAIFKRIWVKNKEIRKIELNPPFDFLLRNQIKKIHSIFPNIKFEHFPLKTT